MNYYRFLALIKTLRHRTAETLDHLEQIVLSVQGIDALFSPASRGESAVAGDGPAEAELNDKCIAMESEIRELCVSAGSPVEFDGPELRATWNRLQGSGVAGAVIDFIAKKAAEAEARDREDAAAKAAAATAGPATADPTTVAPAAADDHPPVVVDSSEPPSDSSSSEPRPPVEPPLSDDSSATEPPSPASDSSQLL